MDSLNDDMREALQMMSVSDAEKKLISDILYTEKIHKDKEWANDARRRLMEFIDEFDDGEGK